jgi:hypothetical protein
MTRLLCALPDGRPGLFGLPQARCYPGLMEAASLPLGPLLTSKESRCASFRYLKPLSWVSEKWTNRSSPPSSGVIKPKPLASLNLSLYLETSTFLYKKSNTDSRLVGGGGIKDCKEVLK